MALAGGWALPSMVVVIPQTVFANFSALLASFIDGFRKCRVSLHSEVNRHPVQPQGFSGFKVSEPLPKQAENQPPSNVKFLGHEGKFAENRIDVEVSALGRVDGA
jgi:hypothetical protein